MVTSMRDFHNYNISITSIFQRFYSSLSNYFSGLSLRLASFLSNNFLCVVFSSFESRSTSFFFPVIFMKLLFKLIFFIMNSLTKFIFLKENSFHTLLSSSRYLLVLLLASSSVDLYPIQMPTPHF